MPGGQVPRGIREQSDGAHHCLLEVGDRSVQLLVDDHVKQRGPPGLERSPERGNDVRGIHDPLAVGAEIASEAGSNASRPLSNSRFVRVLTSDRPAKASWVDDLTDEQLVSTNPVQHAQCAHRPVPDSGFVGAVPEGPAQRGHALDTVHQTVDVIGAHAVQVPDAVERVEPVDRRATGAKSAQSWPGTGGSPSMRRTSLLETRGPRSPRRSRSSASRSRARIPGSRIIMRTSSWIGSSGSSMTWSGRFVAMCTCYGLVCAGIPILTLSARRRIWVRRRSPRGSLDRCERAR